MHPIQKLIGNVVPGSCVPPRKSTKGTMLVMPSNNTGFDAGVLFGRYPGRLGHLHSVESPREPKDCALLSRSITRSILHRPMKSFPWALDNGVFGAWSSGKPWSEEPFTNISNATPISNLCGPSSLIGLATATRRSACGTSTRQPLPRSVAPLRWQFRMGWCQRMSHKRRPSFSSEAQPLGSGRPSTCGLLRSRESTSVGLTPAAYLSFAKTQEQNPATGPGGSDPLNGRTNWRNTLQIYPTKHHESNSWKRVQV